MQLNFKSKNLETLLVYVQINETNQFLSIKFNFKIVSGSNRAIKDGSLKTLNFET